MTLKLLSCWAAVVFTAKLVTRKMRTDEEAFARPSLLLLSLRTPSYLCGAYIVLLASQCLQCSNLFKFDCQVNDTWTWAMLLEKWARFITALAVRWLLLLCVCKTGRSECGIAEQNIFVKCNHSSWTNCALQKPWRSRGVKRRADVFTPRNVSSLTKMM